MGVVVVRAEVAATSQMSNHANVLYDVIGVADEHVGRATISKEDRQYLQGRRRLGVWWPLQVFRKKFAEIVSSNGKGVRGNIVKAAQMGWQGEPE